MNKSVEIKTLGEIKKPYGIKRSAESISAVGIIPDEIKEAIKLGIYDLDRLREIKAQKSVKSIEVSK